MRTTEKNTNNCHEVYSTAVSATSNKSRILLLMMMVIALVFFISSFLAASFSNSPATTTTTTTTTAGTAGSGLEGSGSNCIIVRTAEEKYFADCMFN